MRHDSQPRRRSLRVQYRCTGSMMTTRASESRRAIRHTDRRAAARHHARSYLPFSNLCSLLRATIATSTRGMRHDYSTRRARRGYSSVGAQDEARLRRGQDEDTARVRPHRTKKKRWLQRHGITGRCATARTASYRGTEVLARTDWHNYNDSCWFPSFEVLTPRTTRRSES